MQDSQDEADELQEKYSSHNFKESIDRQALSIAIMSAMLE